MREKFWIACCIPAQRQRRKKRSPYSQRLKAIKCVQACIHIDEQILTLTQFR